VSESPLTISIVTPSFNQAAYLEAAMRSVLDQDYPHLQYVVMDGGSDDGSVEIIGRYDDRLTLWCSERDAGQYDAINRGFARTDGQIMAWLNSDDVYLPWALSTVAEIFAAFPQVQWLTTLYPMTIDPTGRPIACDFVDGYSRRDFFDGAFLPGAFRHARGFIQQESCFWRRSLWEKAGGRIDPAYPLAGDFALWASFFRHAELYAAALPLSCFRRHNQQRSSQQRQRYLEEARSALRRYRHGRSPGRLAAVRQLARQWLLPPPLRRRLAAGGLLRTPHQHWCVYDADAAAWRIVES
jgi:hypothetical protein